MNAFEQIESDETLPLHVKEEMISSLDTFKLFGDIVDLFFVKGMQVASQALGPQRSEVDSAHVKETD